MIIYDVTGKEVHTLLNENLHEGGYEVTSMHPDFQAEFIFTD